MICSLLLISQSDNVLYNPEDDPEDNPDDDPEDNPEDDTAIAFSPWCGGTEISEPGNARVGSPAGHEAYAHLIPTPERCSSEYQKLLKPVEGKLTNCTQLGRFTCSQHICT